MISVSPTAQLRNIGFFEYRAAGNIYWLKEPATSREVLDVEIHTAAHLLKNGHVSALHLARLVSWCAKHVVDGPVPASEMADHLDETFGVVGLLEMKAAIVAAGGLPERVIEQVSDYYCTIHSGGCECPVCKGDTRYEDAGPKSKRSMEALCLFGKFDQVTVGILNLSHGLESTDILQAPWWAYQLETAKRAGKARAYMKKQKQESMKSSASSVLKSRGRA